METKGFTLIETLIVIMMIAILAAMVIPKFSNASAEARESALAKDLSMIRSQIRIYKIHHGGTLPGQGGADIVAQLLGTTDQQGNVVAGGTYGPYLPIFPTNPFTDTDTVESGNGSPGGGQTGWYYNTQTGLLSPDDDAHKDM